MNRNGVYDAAQRRRGIRRHAAEASINLRRPHRERLPSGRGANDRRRVLFSESFSSARSNRFTFVCRPVVVFCRRTDEWSPDRDIRFTRTTAYVTRSRRKTVYRSVSTRFIITQRPRGVTCFRRRFQDT